MPRIRVSDHFDFEMKNRKQKNSPRMALLAIFLFVTVSFAYASEVRVQYSSDLKNWTDLTLTPEMVTTEGGLDLGWLSAPAYFRMDVSEFGFDPTLRNMVFVEAGRLPADSGLPNAHVASFYIGRFEVKWKEWREVREWASANGYDIWSRGVGCAPDHPVVMVSWYDALKWCNAKSEMNGLTPAYWVGGAVYREGEVVPDWNTNANGYRLPADAEWEFAARGGVHSQGHAFSGSDNLDEVGWYLGNSVGAPCDMYDGRGTWPVGQKAANELGIFDMSGNAWEWCWDGWSESRAYRGGGWSHEASLARVSERYRFLPTVRYTNMGLRIARSYLP